MFVNDTTKLKFKFLTNFLTRIFHITFVCFFNIGVVKAMDAAMKSMNLEKISNLMDKFEQQFEDLDVQSGVLENAMSQTTTTTVPQNEVESLMQQVADEAG